MVGANAPVAAMLDEELDGGLGAELPMMAPAAALSLGGFEEQPGPLAMGSPLMQPMAMALPETPYSILNILGLAFTALILLLVGMMMYDLLRNMWSWDSPYNVNSSIMDAILSLFEKK